jgi:glyoxylase-like metal-dependent hydrolase (beta-lactamase superfamily II)
VLEIKIDRIVLGITSCYLVRHEGIILIDAGNSNQESKFERVMERLGVQPDEIQLILATHGHMDHIGSAAKIRDLTGAPIAIHQADHELMEHGIIVPPPGVTSWGRLMAILLKPAIPLFRFQPCVAEIVIGDDGLSLADYGIPGQVFHTPGHTPGSVSLLLETGDAFVGDQAMNGLPFRLGAGLPSLAEDIEQVKASWRMFLENDVRMIDPGHGKPFPADVMRKELLKSASRFISSAN